ncbi:MAG: MATE family efflux transporter [Campylobacteraceae bacterium]|nr:MATE family efflux transporter [Campylobacteraceae bacterium]
MRENQLITRPVPRLLRELAIPAITGILFNTLYNVVDTFYAGLISTQAVAGLSMSFFLYFAVVGVSFGFGSAITALIGNSLGRKKVFLGTLYAHKGIVFVVLIGSVLAFFGAWSAPWVLKAVGAEDSYLPLALEYIRVILYATPFFTATYALNAILVALGDTRSYRNMLIVGFFLNLVLNPLFIYGYGFLPAMGIKGIALSTALIQAISVIYLGRRVLTEKMLSFCSFKTYLPDWRIYRHIFSQGIPPSMNMLTMSLGSVITIYYVATYGYEAVAGYGIAFRVEQIMLLPALGISSAVLSIVSNNFGARLHSRVRESVKLALFYGFGISVLGVILGYTVGEWTVSKFDSNPIVIMRAMEYLYIEVFAFFGYVTLFVCVSALQGIKRPKMILYVGLYRQIIGKIILFSLIVSWLGLPYVGLWYGLFFIIYSSALFLGIYTYKALKPISS